MKLGGKLVARTGFEPVISALRGQRPKPLDERAGIKQLKYAKPENIKTDFFGTAKGRAE